MSETERPNSGSSPELTNTAATAPNEGDLICVRCNNLLVDAVEAPCCHSLYCAKCAPDPSLPPPHQQQEKENAAEEIRNEAHDNTSDQGPTNMCGNCGQVVTAVAKPNIPVRRLVKHIEVNCPNSECEEKVASGLLETHLKECPYGNTTCPNFDKGCASMMKRYQLEQHLEKDCPYRMTKCTQGCGALMQSRDIPMHVKDDCPRTNVHCPSGCGAAIERSMVGSHMASCEEQLIICPLRSAGCGLQTPFPRRQLMAHMNASVHAHLLETEIRHRQLQQQIDHLPQGAIFGWKNTHTWDPAYLECLNRWPAQIRQINAICFVGPYLATGCEGGHVNLFDTDTGEIVVDVATHEYPIRSMIGTCDGKVVIGYLNNELKVYIDFMATCVISRPIFPADRAACSGILGLHLANVPLKIFVGAMSEHQSLPKWFAHPELRSIVGESTVNGSRGGIQSVANNEEGQSGTTTAESRTSATDRIRLSAPSATLQVLLCATENKVRMLEFATLDEICVIESEEQSSNSEVLCIDVLYSKWQSETKNITVEEQGSKDEEERTKTTTVRPTDLPSLLARKMSSASLLATGSADGRARIFNLQDASVPCIGTLIDEDGSAVQCLTFFELSSPAMEARNLGPEVNPMRLIGGTKNGTINIWNLKEGNLSCEYRIYNAHRGMVCSMRNMDGRHLVSGSSTEQLKIWDIDSLYKEVTDQSVAERPCSAYCMTHSGALLFVAGSQGTVREWTCSKLTRRVAK